MSDFLDNLLLEMCPSLLPGVDYRKFDIVADKRGKTSDSSEIELNALNNGYEEEMWTKTINLKLKKQQHFDTYASFSSSVREKDNIGMLFAAGLTPVSQTGSMMYSN